MIRSRNGRRSFSRGTALATWRQESGPETRRLAKGSRAQHEVAKVVQPRSRQMEGIPKALLCRVKEESRGVATHSRCWEKRTCDAVVQFARRGTQQRCRIENISRDEITVWLSQIVFSSGLHLEWCVRSRCSLELPPSGSVMRG